MRRHNAPTLSGALKSALMAGVLLVAGVPGANVEGLGTQVTHAQMVSTSDPDLMVLELQILQDEIIKGNLEAYNLLQPSLIVIGRRFLRLDWEVWSQERQARAAVAFMLSGGSGAVFQELAAQGVTFNIDPNLFAGAMAYAQGNRDAALRLLERVDPIKLPVAIAGQVALAKGILISSQDLEAAQKHFDLARLMMPGTLVEESALRRQAPMVAELGDTAKFERLARRYLFQYSSSVFAKDFRDIIANVISGSSYVEREDEWERVYQLISEFDEDSRRLLLLRMSGAALVTGNTSFARKGAEALLELGTADQFQTSEARLYLSAAKAPSEDWQDALNDLVSIPVSDLSDGAQVLQAAGITVANSVREWPQPDTHPASEFVPYVARFNIREKVLKPELLDPFEAVLADADKALKETEF